MWHHRLRTGPRQYGLKQHMCSLHNRLWDLVAHIRMMTYSYQSRSILQDYSDFCGAAKTLDRRLTAAGCVYTSTIQTRALHVYKTDAFENKSAPSVLSCSVVYSSFSYMLHRLFTLVCLCVQCSAVVAYCLCRWCHWVCWVVLKLSLHADGCNISQSCASAPWEYSVHVSCWSDTFLICRHGSVWMSGFVVLMCIIISYLLPMYRLEESVEPWKVSVLKALRKACLWDLWYCVIVMWCMCNIFEVCSLTPAMCA